MPDWIHVFCFNTIPTDVPHWHLKNAVLPRSHKSKTFLLLSQCKNGGYQYEEIYFVVSSIFHCGSIEKILKHINDIHHCVCLIFLVYCLPKLFCRGSLELWMLIEEGRISSVIHRGFIWFFAEILVCDIYKIKLIAYVSAALSFCIHGMLPRIQAYIQKLRNQRCASRVCPYLLHVLSTS